MRQTPRKSWSVAAPKFRQEPVIRSNGPLEHNPDSKIQQFDSANERDMWIAYVESGRTDERIANKIVRYYRSFLTVVLRGVVRNLPYSPLIDEDDLEAAGNFGLLQCISKFSIESGVKFEVFARARVYGAMIDELRQLQDYPRAIAAARRGMQPKIKRLANKLGHKPNIEEIIQEYGEEVRDILSDPLFSSNVYSQLATGDCDSDAKLSVLEMIPTRAERTVNDEARWEILNQIDLMLKEEELQIILFGYYYMKCTHREIGQSLNMSTSNVVIKRQRAVTKIKMLMSRDKLTQGLRGVST